MAVSVIKGQSIENISLETGVNAYRKGNVVTVVFWNASITSTTARTTYGTLPVGWRPPTDIFSANIYDGIGYGNVLANGEVQGFRRDTIANKVTTFITYVTA